MRKLTTTIITIIFILNHAFVLNSYAEINDSNKDRSGYQAYAVLGSNVEKQGFNTIVNGGSATTPTTPTVTTRDKIECWEIVPTAPKGYVWIDVSEDIGNSLEDGSTYDVEIDYFDQEKGYLFAWYDSLDYGRQKAFEIYTNASNEWKTAYFTLDDAAFSGGVQGYDLCLSTIETGTSLKASAANIYIKEIRIRRNKAVNPVLVEAYSDAPGNTYSDFDDNKIVHATFTNLLNDELELDVKYRLVSESGFTRWQSSESLKLEAKAKITSDINLEINYCDIYTLYIDIICKEKNINLTIEEDTICVVKTDPDGKVCGFAWSSNHFDRFPENRWREAIQLMKMANIGGTRNSLGWGALENEDGSFSWKGIQAHIIDCCNEAGLDSLIHMLWGNRKYMATPQAIPKGKEELEAWARYAEYIATMLKGHGVHHYEVWNEPNLVGGTMNPLNQPASDLAELTKVTRQAIKKVDENALIGGMSLCNIPTDYVFNTWFVEALEAGITDNGMDALTMHPYIGYMPEVRKVYDDLIKYQDKAKEYGVEKIPVWNTEMGHTTVDSGATEYNKSNWICREMILNYCYGVGDINIQYNFEQKGEIDTDREDNFGLVSTLYEKYNREGKCAIPTQSYLAMAGMCYVLGDVSPGEVIDFDDKVCVNKMYSNKFDKNVLALWAPHEVQIRTFDLGVKSIDLYDRYGNKKTLESENGRYTFSLDDRPWYIVGDFNKVSCDESNLFDLSSKKLEGAAGDVFEFSIINNEKAFDEIDVMLYDNAELVKSQKNDNENIFTLKLDGDEGKIFYIEFDISVGDKVQSHIEIPVTLETPITTELRFYPATSKNNNLWKGNVRLSNNRSNKVEKGYIEFLQPQIFRELGRIDLGFLPRNSIVEVSFNAPEIIKKGFYKNISYNVVLSDGYVAHYNETIDFSMATYAANPISIDGTETAGEWPNDTTLVADDISNAKISGWGGPNDLSANIRFAWDEENLYFISEVTDNIYCQENENIKDSWSGDGIQLGIYFEDKDAYIATGQGGTAFHELCIAKVKDGSCKTYRTKVQDTINQQPGPCETAQLACVTKDNKTIYEWAMPWKDITGVETYSPESGDKIGLSILWNDNDGKGRRGWIEYASGIGTSKNNELFTYLNFIK